MLVIGAAYPPAAGRKQIAALVGLALIARDSGKALGKRANYAGRAKVPVVLYIVLNLYSIGPRGSGKTTLLIKAFNRMMAEVPGKFSRYT